MNCLSRIIPIFTLFLLLTQAFAQKTDMSSTGAIRVYTLQECLSIADSTNLDILAAQSTIQGAEADKKAAMGAYFPQVNANMGYSRRLNELGGGQFNIGGFRAPADQFSLSSTANVTVFDGFGRESRIDASHYSLTAIQENIKQTKQQIALAIYQRYIAVLRSMQIVGIRTENLNLGKSQLARVIARFEAGISPIAPVYAQEADNGQRELDLIQAENQLSISKAELLSSMGLSPDLKASFDERSIPAEIQTESLQQFRNQYGSLEESIVTALKKRYDYSAAGNRISAAKSSVDASKSGYYPRIGATGGWSWFNSELNNFDLFSRSFIGFSIDVPIFDAFRVQQQLENSRVQLQQSEIEYKRLEQAIRTQLQTGLLNLTAAEKQMDITARSLKSAELNYQSAKERFDVGTANILEFQTANTQLVTSKINRINAVYNYVDAQYQIRFAIGDL
ncbi:TolC family protein [bacterium]|nr:TolC family protein [bacterium]